MPTSVKPITKITATTIEELAKKVARLPQKARNPYCQLTRRYDERTDSFYPVCGGICRSSITDVLPYCVLRVYSGAGSGITLLCNCERDVIEKTGSTTSSKAAAQE